MKTLLRWALALLGPAILAIFLLTNDLRAVWASLRATDPLLFGLSAVLVVPFLLAKGWRWQLVLQAWEIRIPVVFATLLYTLGIFVGSVTPGQGGDAVKAWYLRRDGHPLGPSLLSIIVDRFFDVAIMGLIAASGLYFYRSFLTDELELVIVLSLALLVAGIAILASAKLRRKLVSFLGRLVPGRLRELAASTGLRDRVLAMSPLRIAQLVLVSFVTLGFTFVRLFLVFLAADLWIDIGPYLALIAIVAIVSVFSVAGIGTRDAAMVLILTGLAASGQMTYRDGSPIPPGQAGALAISLSTLFLILNIINVLLGFLVTLRYPLADALAPGSRAAIEQA
ncbi:MAG TPA: lysylphosphatidylglycerol synthase transmembrane domain-containing protein [Herpetosiphonaceae bacterium]